MAAAGRALRTGKPKPVSVKRFITHNDLSIPVFGANGNESEQIRASHSLRLFTIHGSILPMKHRKNVLCALALTALLGLSLTGCDVTAGNNTEDNGKRYRIAYVEIGKDAFENEFGVPVSLYLRPHGDTQANLEEKFRAVYSEDVGGVSRDNTLGEVEAILRNASDFKGNLSGGDVTSIMTQLRTHDFVFASKGDSTSAYIWYIFDEATSGYLDT